MIAVLRTIPAGLWLLSSATLLLTHPAVAADCQTAPATINYCKRCTTTVSASTTRDTACGGRDTFIIERDYLKDGQLFVIYLKIEMDVR